MTRTLEPVGESYYILATPATGDTRVRVLKQAETFAIFDRSGNMNGGGRQQQGLFHRGTRFLSQCVLSLGADGVLLLSSTVPEDNARMLVDLTNPDIFRDGALAIPRGTIHIARSTLLWGGVCHERLSVANFGGEPADIELVFRFDADFVDLFEVRGAQRERRGRRHPPETDGPAASLRYDGLDGVTRTTRLEWSPRPDVLGAAEARFQLRLAPRAVENIHLAISCTLGTTNGRPLSYENALARSDLQRRLTETAWCHVVTSSDRFNDWLVRSMSDLQMMITQTPQGPYPDAGIPWFSTPFGRDGIITALEMLWVDPELARGVLSFLAATQATEDDPEADAESGRILHEMREGEMAALGEIPFRRYYGSVDATPLFVMLAGAYYETTGDRDFIASLWPVIERALAWMDASTRSSPNGFLSYQRRSSRGLLHQGWKDSLDSVFHADGLPAQGPIALCEVQGYAYGACRMGSVMARALRMNQRAEELAGRAADLRERFDDSFWVDRLGLYALALDGQGRRCEVKTSNPGHCLFTGIAFPERAGHLAEALMSDDMFSGWGVRTVGTGEARYNPMSYHNGSVWPHDNALLAQGLARYGHKHRALAVMNCLFDATYLGDMRRLPELFCGFTRRPGEGPTLYPVACAPQAWAAGAVFMLLRAVLGLSIDVPHTQLRFFSPVLPPYLNELRLQNLRVGRGHVDVVLHRYRDDVGVSILRREGPVDVVVYK
ncbi:MAG: amylo-alpha-1,6-glucosidase [Candidatus Polarisedimenticolia bacterium]